MRTILGDEATTSGIRERVLAQEVIYWPFSPAEPRETRHQRKTFSKLHVLRGVQQCEVTYEEHTAITSLRFGPQVPAVCRRDCYVWSVLRLVHEVLQ